MGLVVGYLLVAGWRQIAPAGSLAQAPAARARTGSATPVPVGSSSFAPRRSAGSSATVIGGLSPQELARIQTGAAPPQTPLPGAAMAAAGAPLAPGETPAAVAFPGPVQAAAQGYLCLCGCPHDLASCPCNDQPIGAVTMLTFLQRLLDQGLERAAADTAMVDRYGDRVLVAPPPAAPDPGGVAASGSE